MLGVILLTVVLPGAIALVVMLLARATPALCRAAPALALGAAGSIGTCLVLGRLPALPGRAGEDWLPLLFLASGLLGAHAAIARRPGISRLLPIALALALLAMPLANAWRAWSIGTIALAWAAGLVILAAPAWALAVLARRERTRHASEWCVIASCLGGGGALLLGYTGKYAQISLILAMVAGAAVLTRGTRPIGGSGTTWPKREGSASAPAVIAPFHACLVLMGCFYADLHWGAAGLLMLAPLGAALRPGRGIFAGMLIAAAAVGVQWAAR